MIRLLLPVLLIVVPLVSYIVWLKLAKENKALRAQGKLPQWRDAPWTLIVLATLLAVGLLLAALALFDGNDPRGAYTPPSYVDGEIEPGKVTE
jgi:hypothetical protein